MKKNIMSQFEKTLPLLKKKPEGFVLTNTK